MSKRTKGLGIRGFLILKKKCVCVVKPHFMRSVKSAKNQSTYLENFGKIRITQKCLDPIARSALLEASRYTDLILILRPISQN